VVQASTATPNPTTADSTDNTQLTASTDTIVKVNGGTMSLYNVKDSINFGTINVVDAFTNNLSTKGDSNLTASVDDFQGVSDASDAWTLTATLGKWQAGDGGTAAGAKVLDGAEVKANGTTTIGTAAVDYATGAEGHTDLAEQSISLETTANTFLKAGTYTNQINWQLKATVDSEQK
jgi:hypothetical protein